MHTNKFLVQEEEAAVAAVKARHLFMIVRGVWLLGRHIVWS